MTRRFANLALVFMLLVCFPGIGSTDDLQDRASAAAKVFPDAFQFFYVPSSGEIADATPSTYYENLGWNRSQSYSLVARLQVRRLNQ